MLMTLAYLILQTDDHWSSSASCLFVRSTSNYSTLPTQMTISPEKQKQIEGIASEIGEILGTLVGNLIASAIIAGIIYGILHFMIGLSVTYLQTLGVLLIVNFLKNTFKK